jgi:hypothetical protein
MEHVLGIEGMHDKEAGQVLDTRLRALEEQHKRTFVEFGLILFEVQNRELWRYVIDPLNGEVYRNFSKWVEGAAPSSRRDCFAALAAIKELADVPPEQLAEMPRCNIETLKLLSISDRKEALYKENGETISVIEAAKTMRLKEFVVELQKRFHLKLMRPNGGRVRSLLGEFLNFRGLQHAPVNEQGVVFLFGMVARELDYVVEVVRTGFPDCEAKHRVGKDRWEKVRIEFEFKSHNFIDHDHDINGCDLIVCWENNWDSCPLEVLELSAIIETLDPNS